MFQSTRWLWVVLVIGGAMLSANAVNGQDKKPAVKHDASALNLALRDVINAGAILYNENGDHAGCFRMYQGSLLSVKPFVASDLQKKIDASLASSDKLGSYADRAHELRKVLNEIRERTKAPAEKIMPPIRDEKSEGKEKKRSTELQKQDVDLNLVK
jgi:hypothetical protein